ncbi:MAG: CDP-archaeol synthase [Planctomycetes bacterium]|nr:CDP-archaeol synthase [Planctomycetota bacterium]
METLVEIPIYLGRILWLALPVVLAGAAHMGVVSADIAPWLKIPLDGGAIFRGKRVFGNNKTVRGLLAMALFTALFFQLQSILYERFEWARSASFFDYTLPGRIWSPIAAGAVYGLGYALAELPNSLVKRRLGIGAGREATGVLRWIFLVVDQGDSVLGCLLAILLFWRMPWHVFVSTLAVCTGLHLALNALLYAARLRRRPV